LYALCARHGLRALPIPALQLLAVFQSHGVDGRKEVDSAQLKTLMEELNGGFPILDSEVEEVIAEASLVCGDEGIRRFELMRGLGAWYANVQRQASEWPTFIQAQMSALVHGREYHTALLELLRLQLPIVIRALRRQQKRLSSEASFSAERNLPSPVRRFLELVWGALLVLALLAALVLPGALFAFAIYVGCEHGNDACRHDLDGLLTWFGILGLAFLFVGCADANSYRPSWMGFLLRTVLLVFPWVGTTWTFHLRWDDQQLCGPTLVYMSMFLWTSLLLLELFGACTLCWGAAVFAEHEFSLQHSAREGLVDNTI